MRRIWLASFPKSGNTWVRMLLAALTLAEGRDLDINALPERSGIASARDLFDHVTLIPSGLLTHDECDRLRPRLYEAAAEIDLGAEDGHQTALGDVRFVKVHDAYTGLGNGEPLLAGARGASGAVLIVRDPRDVTSSLANHMGMPVDQAIALMADREGALGQVTDRQSRQLRQKLCGWSGHAESWLTQTDIPVLVLHYEKMKADTAGALSRVLDFAGCQADEAVIARAVRAADFGALKKREMESGFREVPKPEQGRVFFRRGEAGAWREELTRQQVQKIESAHGTMMQRLGYPLSCEGGR
jgi:hypothetical protein